MNDKIVNGIIAYENDELDQDQVIDLFQNLVDNGMAWSLQGHYGRTAEWLIEHDYISPPRRERNKKAHGKN